RPRRAAAGPRPGRAPPNVRSDARPLGWAVEMSTPERDTSGPVATSPGGATQHRLLPADDPALFELGLDELADRWRDAAGRSPMTAEAMTGADRRAQRFGLRASVLMEHAGTAAAAATR